MKRIRKNLFLFLTAMVLSSLVSQAQELKQTIRGKVIDKFTQSPLPGASIVITGSDPLIGITSNVEGDFEIQNVPVGRVNLQITFLGYENYTVLNLQVFPSKETVLIAELEEKAVQLEDVIISAGKNRNETFNQMATVSARTFNVEETNKYAGSLGDPARMAGNFAGVLSVDDSRNDIIIRGNSPYGLLWQVDGIEIPNPNHYSMPGSKGGPMSMLNNNNLANSDFLTGAFPSEFGNALSGVFELNLRNGNTFKKEHVFQLATSGFELGTEGPVNMGKASSYILNYRYSAPQIFDLIGLWEESYMPKYQDLTAKINLPDTKLGYFQLFVLGGLNSIVQDSRKIDSTDWSYGLDGMVMDMSNKMGVMGLSHTLYLNKKSHFVTKLSAQFNNNVIKIDSVMPEQQTFFKSKINSLEKRLLAKTALKTKFNPKNYLIIGAEYELCNTDYSMTEFMYNGSPAPNLLDINKNTNSLSAYIQYRHRFSNRVSLTLGSRYFAFLANNTDNLEPRAGIRYKLSDTKSLSFGYGIHSQKQNNAVYYIESYNKNTGSYEMTNENLEMTKSQHFVLSYNSMLKESLNLKLETYYQNLWDVPVTHKQPQFSMLNTGGGFDLPDQDSLVNLGTGYNYGIDITLEKYLSDNYYFLVTASLFQSKYKGYDKVLRNTEFNGNYAFNALAGYDLKLNNKYILGMNIRSIYAGGRRELPIDVDASAARGETIYDWDNAYENRYPDYYRLDFRISLKEFHKKYTSEFAVDITNITDNQDNIINRYYSNTSKAVTTDYQDGRQINFLFKIYF